MDQHDRPDRAGFDPQLNAGVTWINAAVLTTPQRDVVEATLGAIRQGMPLVVVTGDPGSGRSTVADHVAKVLLGRGLRVDRALPPDGLAPEALLARVASLLDLDPAFLARAALPPAPVIVATGPVRAVAIVVDNADAWPAGVLRMLLGLVRVRLVDGPLLHVILLGQATSLRPMLSREILPAHASLRIVPLSLAQGREYLGRHLAAIPPAGASLSAQAANDILARAGGSPGRINALVCSCLVARQGASAAPAGTRAAGGATLFRRSAMPVTLLASLLLLGVVAATLLTHPGTTPILPDPARRPAHATSLPATPDVAGPAPAPGCLGTLGVVTEEAEGTAQHLPPDPPCPTTVARLRPLAPIAPMPLPATSVVAPLLLLVHAPVVIETRHVLPTFALGLSSLTGLALPPRLEHLPVLDRPPTAAAVAPSAAARQGVPFPRRSPAEAAATPLGVSGRAAPPGRASVPGQKHPDLLPAQPRPSVVRAVRTTDPDRAHPRVVDRMHDAPAEQPSPGTPADRGGIRDNPAGLVSRAGVPYFCSAIRSGNQAETAYIRQVCSR